MFKLQAQALRAWLLSGCPSGTKGNRPIEAPHNYFRLMGLNRLINAPPGRQPGQQLRQLGQNARLRKLRAYLLPVHGRLFRCLNGAGRDEGFL
jgi:hypothetical protein